MYVLGIETSCDETGVALYHSRHGLVSHVLHSQVRIHAEYGGVVPELASRDHICRLIPLIRRVLAEAGIERHELNGIAYTAGPGLMGALLVGASVARSMAYALGIPALGIHHMEGHLLAPLLEASRPDFPFVALLVSGGHTQLMRVEAVGRYELLGETIDDAAGEAFDKSAKLMGLGYPGGPALARLASRGRAEAYALPRPLMHSGDLDFSFAGLKTAVMSQHRKLGDSPTDQERADLAASAQAAIVEVLVHKSMGALRRTGLRRLVVAGGVGANAELRAKLQQACQSRGVRVHYPELHLCTDNGAMIAMAAAMRLQAGLVKSMTDDLDGATGWAAPFGVRPRWPLDQVGP